MANLLKGRDQKLLLCFVGKLPPASKKYDIAVLPWSFTKKQWVYGGLVGSADGVEIGGSLGQQRGLYQVSEPWYPPSSGCPHSKPGLDHVHSMWFSFLYSENET